MMYPEFYVAVLVCLPAFTQALTDAEVSKFHSNVVVSRGDGTITFSSDSIPTHSYGPFPSADNPNTVSAQNFQVTVNDEPVEASSSGCMNLGAIGMAINGVAFYNPYTLENTDAVVNEVMDSCGGHPSPSGGYHYHQYPKCVYDDSNNQFLGVAKDGYPIYGIKDENGKELTSADLDECHGRTYNGQYQYHMTRDFPYILGCFKGTVSNYQSSSRCSKAVADEYDENAGSGATSLTTLSSTVAALLTMAAVLAI